MNWYYELHRYSNIFNCNAFEHSWTDMAWPTQCMSVIVCICASLNSLPGCKSLRGIRPNFRPGGSDFETVMAALLPCGGGLFLWSISYNLCIWIICVYIDHDRALYKLDIVRYRILLCHWLSLSLSLHCPLRHCLSLMVLCSHKHTKPLRLPHFLFRPANLNLKRGLWVVFATWNALQYLYLTLSPAPLVQTVHFRSNMLKRHRMTQVWIGMNRDKDSKGLQLAFSLSAPPQLGNEYNYKICVMPPKEKVIKCLWTTCGSEAPGCHVGAAQARL